MWITRAPCKRETARTCNTYDVAVATRTEMDVQSASQLGPTGGRMCQPDANFCKSRANKTTAETHPVGVVKLAQRFKGWDGHFRCDLWIQAAQGCKPRQLAQGVAKNTQAGGVDGESGFARCSAVCKYKLMCLPRKCVSVCLLAASALITRIVLWWCSGYV